MWLTIGVVRVLELFEKGLGLSGESLYVNTWCSQPLFQQSSLTVPHTEPGLMVKAHTRLWLCAKPPRRLPPQATVSPAGTHYSLRVRATERNIIA